MPRAPPGLVEAIEGALVEKTHEAANPGVQYVWIECVSRKQLVLLLDGISCSHLGVACTHVLSILAASQNLLGGRYRKKASLWTQTPESIRLARRMSTE